MHNRPEHREDKLDPIISITISVVSLTWGAGRSFFVQREVHLADPAPPALMVLARVFFYMLTVTINSLVLWTFIGSLLGRFTALAPFLISLQST